MKKVLFISKSPNIGIFDKSLEREGYSVFSLCKKPFLYNKTFIKKMFNIFYRVVKKDKLYLDRDCNKQYQKEIYKRIYQSKEKYDYTIFFRADLFSEKIIKECKNKSNFTIAYQCDGKTSELLNPYKKYLDRIFFFDKTDLESFGNNSLPLTNCWFPDDNSEKNIKQDFFYIGVGIPERIKSIESFSNYISNKNFNSKIILTINEFVKEREISKRITLSHKGLSYEENIEQVKKSKALIDLKLNRHNGLSFRFFEALYYKKKIITNNKTVKEYDFYHPNNIFITDFENFDGLEEFMQKPYAEIEQSIVDKYGFKNWIRYVLDLPPYQKIDIH